ncbi:MAG: hypothetical protein HY094_08170 [Candidatus Melainabacteria bacterium]|nr:hypothetical protein [Candidatus Melainabacteria bacterium]
MDNQSYGKEQPHLLNWQIAYAARELRHNKTVTLSCLKSEAGLVLEQLSSFSNASPIKTKTVNKPNSKEVYLEIIETI